MNSIAQAFVKSGVVPQPRITATAAPTADILDVLNDIQLDHKARASITYAKARCAIEAAFHNRKQRREAKLAVIEYLGGTLVHPTVPLGNKTPLPNFVLFDDSSKARF